MADKRDRIETIARHFAQRRRNMGKPIVKAWTGTNKNGNKVKYEEDKNGGHKIREYRQGPNGVVVVTERNYPPPSQPKSN
jgi:hypothetical protein